MSSIFGLANNIISAPFSIGSNLLGGLLGGGGGGLFSGLEGDIDLGSGLLTTLEPLILMFVGVEVLFTLIDKI